MPPQPDSGTSGRWLALDFGGTKLTVGVFSPDTAELDRRTVPAGSTASDSYDRVLSVADELLGDDRAALRGVGASFGGPTDAARGVVRRSYHVPGWDEWPLAERLEGHFGVPASIDNDANAGALGEWRFGQHGDLRTLLYITVSTGVGAGWIIDGQPYSGRDGMAGEIGHCVVDPQGPPCVCGKRGCVEVLASGQSIGRAAVRGLAEAGAPDGPLRRRMEELGGALTGRDVAGASEQGDPLASEVLFGAARALGLGIGTACNLMNPDLVVLGGGVTNAGSEWLETVRAAARETVLDGNQVDITTATLGDDAPLWGATALALTARANP